jgi:hypothetical protein
MIDDDSDDDHEWRQMRLNSFNSAKDNDEENECPPTRKKRNLWEDARKARPLTKKGISRVLTTRSLQMD